MNNFVLLLLDLDGCNKYEIRYIEDCILKEKVREVVVMKYSIIFISYYNSNRRFSADDKELIIKNIETDREVVRCKMDVDTVCNFKKNVKDAIFKWYNDKSINI